jgi:hypothetical protein
MGAAGVAPDTPQPVRRGDLVADGGNARLRQAFIAARAPAHRRGVIHDGAEGIADLVTGRPRPLGAGDRADREDEQRERGLVEVLVSGHEISLRA